MSKLAINGGKPAVEGRLEPYDSITRRDIESCEAALSTYPLSGFLGGKLQGGPWVNNLEAQWADTFGVKHAIACNSGTSGLLIACMAAGVERESEVVVPAYTMSATAAAPAFLGGKIKFGDIAVRNFCLMPDLNLVSGQTKAVIATNLFGHPAKLSRWRQICNDLEMCLIEDNAQAIFAMENGKYAGTIGHIGVFSLNVHKQIQCGEGGICVTNDDELAHRMRMALNHGELAGGSVGLNLRMTEYTAAIAQTQLRRGKAIVAERVEIAEEIIVGASGLFEVPVVRSGCTHSYYMIPWLVVDDREWLVKALQAEGVPVRAGYVEPLNRLPAFKSPDLLVTSDIDRRIITLENCAYTPTPAQLKQFKTAFEKVADAYSGQRNRAELSAVCDSRGELQP